MHLYTPTYIHTAPYDYTHMHIRTCDKTAPHDYTHMHVRTCDNVKEGLCQITLSFPNLFAILCACTCIHILHAHPRLFIHAHTYLAHMHTPQAGLCGQHNMLFDCPHYVHLTEIVILHRSARLSGPPIAGANMSSRLRSPHLVSQNLLLHPLFHYFDTIKYISTIARTLRRPGCCN